MKNSFYKTSINEVKDYWNKWPCNKKNSLSEVGTKKYFEDIEREKYSVEPHIHDFAEFKKWKGKRVLEIGCGIGTDTINFARSGAEITAIDLSEESLAIAKKRAEIFSLSNKIKFYCVNAEELSKVVPIESYDLIYSFGVIHHTPHPERVVNEIRKYSKKGTIIKIMLYHRFSWPVAWILFKGGGAFWKIDELIAKYSESRNCPVTYTYSKRQIKKLFKDFNLINIKTEYPIGRSNFIRNLNKKIPIFGLVINYFINFLTKPFGWHLLITATSSK